MILIIWKERNIRIFQNKYEHLQTLLERVKLQSFLWLKLNVIFDFDYHVWRLNPYPAYQIVL